MTTIPPGPELDRLVAEKVMGWTWVEYRLPVPQYGYILGGPCWVDLGRIEADEITGRRHPTWHHSWSPSTNIANAWEVVERMATDHHLEVTTVGAAYWRAAFRRLLTTAEFSETAADAPHAICLAALKAVS